MLAVHQELARRQEARLIRQNLVTGQRMHDHHWPRYYPDFCGESSGEGED